jgi:hypothetical protein
VLECAGALRHSTRVVVAGGGRKDVPQNIHACHKQDVLGSEQPSIVDRVRASRMCISRSKGNEMRSRSRSRRELKTCRKRDIALRACSHIDRDDAEMLLMLLTVLKH